MWIFILIPNIIWMICIFYVLYQDKIDVNKKILYLLIFNLIFMFSDFILGKEFITDDSVDFIPPIVEFIQLFIIAYWLNKQKNISVLGNQNTQNKNLIYGFLGLVISVILIGLIYFLIIL